MNELLDQFKQCLALEPKYIHIENDGSFYMHQVNSTLCIYFEWSNGKLDWRHNFAFAAKPYRDMKDKWRCHRGFLKVWKSIEPYVKDAIMSPTVEEIKIVGYSHGGAIAQLCYEYVKFNRPDISVSGVGFGAPRVIWGHVRKAVRERFKGFVVVRNGNDIVTHLPPVIFGFRHICEVQKIGIGSDGLIKDHYPERYEESLWLGEFEEEGETA